MRLPLTASFLALVLSGCDLLLPGAAPGTVTGVVRFNGQPAAGKRVSLLPNGGRAITDAEGRYTFTGVSEGKYQIYYLSQSDREGAVPNEEAGLNEVYSWRSPDFEIGPGGGRELKAFDVSYNGLLYPDKAMSLIVSETSPVPFHFSPHVQGGRYRLRLRSAGSDQPAWVLDWTQDPTAIFAQPMTPGSYFWRIEIENHAGTGLTIERGVDF